MPAPRSNRMLQLALILAIAGVLYLVWAGYHPVTSQVNVDALGPKELVGTFFASLANHDLATARRCLASDREVPLSDYGPLSRVEYVSVSDPLPANPDLEAIVRVRYLLTTWLLAVPYRETRFVAVSRAGQGSPWKIVGIGTGP